jgi:hypothetical protein
MNAGCALSPLLVGAWFVRGCGRGVATAALVAGTALVALRDNHGPAIRVGLALGWLLARR